MVRNLKYGAPLGRPITPPELRPYKVEVERFIRLNESHPALVTAYAELQRMVDDAGRHPVTRPPARTDHRGLGRVELARLYAGGVTGSEMFQAVAAIHLFAHRQPRSLEVNSKAYWYAVARSILALRHRRDIRSRGVPSPNRFATSRVSTFVLLNLGRSVAMLLAPLLSEMATAIDRGATAERDRRQSIATAVASHPFAIAAPGEPPRDLPDLSPPTTSVPSGTPYDHH
jgi:hypothetical protein